MLDTGHVRHLLSEIQSSYLNTMGTQCSLCLPMFGLGELILEMTMGVAL